MYCCFGGEESLEGGLAGGKTIRTFQGLLRAGVDKSLTDLG